MILHVLEGDFPYYQSITTTTKMYYAMVKDMVIAKGSQIIYEIM